MTTPFARRVTRIVGATAVALGLTGLSATAASAAPTTSPAHTVQAVQGAQPAQVPVDVTFRGYSTSSHWDAYYDSLLSAVTTFEISNGVSCYPEQPYVVMGPTDAYWNWAAAASGNVFQVRQWYYCS